MYMYMHVQIAHYYVHFIMYFQVGNSQPQMMVVSDVDGKYIHVNSNQYTMYRAPFSECDAPFLLAHFSLKRVVFGSDTITCALHNTNLKNL